MHNIEALDSSTQEFPIVSFLKEVMRRRQCLPSHLADHLGVSHSTVSRWLSGNDIAQHAVLPEAGRI